jgi:hypothetical protein
MDATTGEIVAAALTTNDVDDACHIGPLLDQLAGPVAPFTGDGAYDQDSVYRAVIYRDPDVAVIVPPRSTAVPSVTAETEPTQRDRNLQRMAEKGRMGWQKASGKIKCCLSGLGPVLAPHFPDTEKSPGDLRLCRLTIRQSVEVG